MCFSFFFFSYLSIFTSIVCHRPSIPGEARVKKKRKKHNKIKIRKTIIIIDQRGAHHHYNCCSSSISTITTLEYSPGSTSPQFPLLAVHFRLLFLFFSLLLRSDFFVFSFFLLFYVFFFFFSIRLFSASPILLLLRPPTPTSSSESFFCAFFTRWLSIQSFIIKTDRVTTTSSGIYSANGSCLFGQQSSGIAGIDTHTRIPSLIAPCSVSFPPLPINHQQDGYHL